MKKSPSPTVAQRRGSARTLALVVSLALAAGVMPARSRDRSGRGTRSAPTRVGGGSQRWDGHHDAGELPLHVTEADFYRATLGTDSTAGPPLGSASDRNEDERIVCEPADVMSDLVSVGSPDAPAPASVVEPLAITASSRAPPAFL